MAAVADEDATASGVASVVDPPLQPANALSPNAAVTIILTRADAYLALISECYSKRQIAATRSIVVCIAGAACDWHHHPVDDVAKHLAAHLREVRAARGLSQAQVAKLAGIPRATWTQLESGDANPTLQVLLKASAALQIRLEELLAPPRPTARHYASSELATKTKSQVEVRKLVPEPLPGLEIERMTFPKGARVTGIPHTPGTREYLTCERGKLELRVAGDRYVLEPGDVVVFRGDQRHGYTNIGRTTAVGYSVLTFAPTVLAE